MRRGLCDFEVSIVKDEERHDWKEIPEKAESKGPKHLLHTFYILANRHVPHGPYQVRAIEDKQDDPKRPYFLIKHLSIALAYPKLVSFLP